QELLEALLTLKKSGISLGKCLGEAVQSAHNPVEVIMLSRRSDTLFPIPRCELRQDIQDLLDTWIAGWRLAVHLKNSFNHSSASGSDVNSLVGIISLLNPIKKFPITRLRGEPIRSATAD